MMRVLTSLLRYKVVSDRTPQVLDVVHLRGLDSTPYVLLGGERVELPPDTFAINVRSPSTNQPYMFLDNSNNTYYPATPVQRILTENFYIKAESQSCYYVVVNGPLIPPSDSSIMERANAHPVLQTTLAGSLTELSRTESVERGTLPSMLLKNVMISALYLKEERVRLESMLKVVEERMEEIEGDIREAEERLRIRSRRRVRWFTSFLMGQAAILHYFIYFNLSWDIMEPITCILANIDILVGYYFFLLKGVTFSPANWVDSMVKNRRNRHLAKEGIDVQKYEEYQRLKEYLTQRVNLLSADPLDVVKVVKQPLTLLDTR